MNATSASKLIITFVTSLLLSSNVFSAVWPDRPIRIIVPYPPGGGVDAVARTYAQRLGDILNTNVIVENKAGASGAIGADLVAKSAPDGYTLLIASPAEIVVGPSAGQKVPYDPKTDLTPISLIGETPLVIAAHPNVPAKNLSEFIVLAKTNPGKYSYGTPGNGSSMQFAGESLNAIAGIDVLHVPYKGAAPALADALGGQIPIAIIGMPPTIAHAKNGKITILAVTSEKRSSAMPDVMAVAELPNMKGYRFTNWMGLFVPAKTSNEIVSKLAIATNKLVKEPATHDKLLSQGVEPIGSSPKEFAEFLKSEYSTYSKIAVERNIKMND
ncbi:tripartite tricarboxylate transporter substrate binding protein [Polynucleobacter sp. 71A-WALBACH]|uniref:Bug family tripartite tricarboxylate transporter substrate binding protein n=1 Tax=Polynucleobacter sp. 71A-WALBACH TaxID=2689097 RepID=UPI001C0C3309|nr:tripartite tricarboxylate transporter substrate binding protein [Polynucleobacter sp. 71A-WALBACH]MBU3594305.1 tripartite tricarboxylate transporter substrate binding protein [Polynucleobacter sp. 71A-WALBACH]